jgi:hypothetical protein
LTVDINGDQGTTGRQGLVKKCPEGRFFMAISDRMLFPDERVGSHGVQVIIVNGAKRPEFDKLAFQDRLVIE